MGSCSCRKSNAGGGGQIRYKRRPGRSAGKRRQIFLALAAGCLAASLTLFTACARSRSESLAAGIAPKVLRFHVLADSDSPEDQRIKLAVRDLLLSEIREGFSRFRLSSGHSEKAELQAYILLHREELELQAEAFMEELGAPGRIRIRLESAYFPTRIYGDMTFPCGVYDAVRVVIGEGKGHNWWCVLYPSLCFTSSSFAVVPESSEAELRCLLDESTFEGLCQSGNFVFGESAGIPVNEAAAPAKDGTEDTKAGTGGADTDKTEASAGCTESAGTDRDGARKAGGDAGGPERKRQKKTEKNGKADVRLTFRFLDFFR